MAGIYLHIPFCRKACYYCDFHFSTNTKLMDEMVTSISKELQLRKQFFTEPATIDTIYFGGGTPSLLPVYSLELLLKQVYSLFTVSDSVEITLEANPEDINHEHLIAWKNLGINRLSVGVQSFQDHILEFVNRAHTGKQAYEAITLAQKVGITNISLDLIYGIPKRKEGEWEQDVEKALSLGTPHISSYCLTVEPKTVFGHQLKKGNFPNITDKTVNQEYFYLVSQLKAKGFDHYEVSNFAQPNLISKHNSSYWKGMPYLGVGPGAHSFDGESTRTFNISHNPKYIKALTTNEIFYEQENLSQVDKLNEYLMIRFRTSWGVDLNYVKSAFQIDLKMEYPKLINEFASKDWLIEEKGTLFLTQEGRLFADYIAAEFFMENEA